MKLSAIRKFLLVVLCSISLSAMAAVDINTATAEQLAKSLNGVGPAKAAAIVAYREANGPFKSLEQLTEVKGIGASTVEKNREMMSVGATEAKPKNTQ